MLVRPLDVGAPFHVEATVRLLQRRAANRVDVWLDECYSRALPTAAGLIAVEVRDHGSVDAPDVRYTLRGGSFGADFGAMERSLRRLLGADSDPHLLSRVAAIDCGTAVSADAHRALEATALALRGVRIPRYPTLFEAFANVVPFQQVSLDAGIAIVGRLVGRFGGEVRHGGRRYAAFPSAAAIAGADTAALRACGLSARKAETLRNLARMVDSGSLSEAALERSDSEEAAKILRGLPGIGPWSAALVLLRGLGRTDVFPPGDVGARRVLGGLLNLGADAGIERIA
ncbi:MAG: DNA-3-methyladenine glycosylase 2 family protein, partial [Gammaproteobacteria bacterium]|nr:DNA-3-methyladenine glycosylase 2 family protein [Gammaproteobacteria bacterium]